MILVLLSGGEDSIVLAEMAQEKGTLSGLMFFEYGQPAQIQERMAADRWCKKNGYDLTVQHVPIFGVSDHMKTGAGTPGPRILPGRNLLFISHAINLAKTIGAHTIWYGANADDHEYADCSVKFVEMADKIARLHGVRVEAPLLHMSKKEIHQYADDLPIDLSCALSCYEPNSEGLPCGTCNSCRLQAKRPTE